MKEENCECNCGETNKHFVISGSKVREYDMELVRDIQPRRILHWNYRNLTEFPHEVLDYGSHLEEIYLKRNQIAKLPPEVGRLENLTNLYLIANQLTTLPTEIGQLRNLKVLDLSQNNLSEVPSSITQLLKLEQLILTHNQIYKIPVLSKLKCLVFLELSGNKLRSLEFLINGLDSLAELIIDQNPQLTLLPRNLSQLPKLRYLSVCQGNLTFLPGISCFNDQEELLEVSNGASSSSPSRQPPTHQLRPQIRVDGNPMLNYLPFWIHTDIESFDCYGSGTLPEEVHSSFQASSSKSETSPLSSQSFLPSSYSRIRLFLKGEPHTLHFDEDLCKINQSKTIEPCSLVELSLRIVYKETNFGHTNSLLSSSAAGFLKRNEEDYSFIIPYNLARILEMGPVAKCFQCNQPIFTEVWPMIFTIPEQNLHDENHDAGFRLKFGKCSIKLSVIYFCSSNCSIIARNVERSRRMRSIYIENEILFEMLPKF